MEEKKLQEERGPLSSTNPLPTHLFTLPNGLIGGPLSSCNFFSSIHALEEKL
jgi:hypothetical protein